MQALLTKIGKVGHVEGDDVELKIKKSFVVYLAIFMSVGGLVWGCICIFYDLTLPSFIPFGYLVISFFNIIYFKLTKNFSVVRFVQIFISLSLPVAFQWVLGGFSSSGNIILWSLLSLIASLSFVSTQSSIRWLVFFALMVTCSVIFDDQAKAFKPDILPESSAVFFGVNIVMISSIVFGLVTFFVSQYDKAKKEIEVKNLQIVRVAKKVKASYLELQSAHERLKNEVATGVTNEVALANYESILKSQKALIDSFSSKRN